VLGRDIRRLVVAAALVGELVLEAVADDLDLGGDPSQLRGLHVNA
jgi:hypothetical protein